MSSLIRLTKREDDQLRYLARSHVPLWGGHLKRGDPITDPDMQRWLEQGLIEVVGTEGYRVTPLCRATLGRGNAAFDEDLLRDLPADVWTEGDIGRALLQLAAKGRCKYTRLNATLGRFEPLPRS